MPDTPQQPRKATKTSQPEHSPRETASQRRVLMQLSSAGFELASFSLLLGAAGYGVDHWLENAKPYFAVAGVILGFCLGFYRLIVLANKMN